MFSWLKHEASSADCNRFRVEIEQTEGTAALSPAQKQHLAQCVACQTVADDISATRALLSDIPAAMQPAPWFAPRVMAAIAARESEMRRSLEAWAAVPRFAARLTWVSALALLLAGTWLYKSPHSPQSVAQNSGAQTSVESLFDSPQSAASDDILPAERGQ
jgi:hypothetical protein